jgi:hypothetical protein
VVLHPRCAAFADRLSPGPNHGSWRDSSAARGPLHGGSIQKVTSIDTGKTFGTSIRELDSPDEE